MLLRYGRSRRPHKVCKKAINETEGAAMTVHLAQIDREILRAEEGTPQNEFHLGDAAEIAQRLRETYEGRVNLVYLDPPFLTGKTFEARVRVGAKEWKTGRGSLVLRAYQDNQTREAYLKKMRAVLVNARALMASDALIYVHIDWRMHPYLRLLMDEIFGEGCFLNEIIWAYQSGGSARRYFPRKHDVILMYSKTKDYDFHIQDVAEVVPGGRENHMKRHVDADGRVYRSIRSGGRVYTYYDDDPVVPGDVWTDVNHLQQKDPQRTGYDTQKPLRLLERIIRSSSRPGGLVMDLFAGSGTTAEAAVKNGRRFLAADDNPLSMQLVHRRTDGVSVRFTHAPFDGAPEIRARAESGIGFTAVRLEAFRSDDPTLPESMDAVDGWAAGYERDGVFYAYAEEIRSREKPEPTFELAVPMYEGRLMLRVTDVKGRVYFGYVDASAMS